MPHRLLLAGRGVLLSLAAAAVALTLLAPACARPFMHGAAPDGPIGAVAVAAGATGHGDPSAPCCSSVSHPADAGPVLAAAEEWKTAPGVASLVLVLLIPASIPRHPNPRRAPPRGSPSFYLRSTRILR